MITNNYRVEYLMRETSSIVSATLVLAGRQTCEDLGVSRFGEADAMVSLLLGPVLYRIRKPALVVDRIYQVWKTAAIYRARLPRALGSVPLPKTGSLATCVLNLTAYPAVAAHLTSGQTALDKPHLAIQVGALHLEIKDLDAYESTLDAWQRARELIRPEE
ncbi:hypothetical protein JNUCC0626_32170 [Lentzea sp. JNUCC 0626]|uniref:hypothetical protein n=1 Tax=Lentzea sp. JNUCC 0626 TaxID=3367513 RepID=UPI003747CB32